MSLRNPSIRALRLLPQHLAQQQCLRSSPQFQPLLYRNLTTERPSSSTSETPRNPLDPVALHRLEAERRAYYKRRSYYATAGFIFGMIAIYVTATSIDLPPPNKPNKLDSSKRADDPMVVLGRERKVVVQKLGEEPEERPDVVETGTTHVPAFPRVLDFYDDERDIAKANETKQTTSGVNDDRLVEYQLVGLGIRTVSFLRIQVYVVGMYVATDDIAALQETLIKKVQPGVTALVAGEKGKLRSMLMQEGEGVKLWNEVLKDAGARTLIRIVPTRNTDFHHLRDAWVKHLTARAQSNKEEYGDEAFGTAVGEFKTLFNRGSVPKGKELLLSRDRTGKLAVWYDDGKNGAQRLGHVNDERISRGVWLNYVAGKTVASEGARKSIVDGIMEFVERPVGTVATKVQLHV